MGGNTQPYDAEVEYIQTTANNSGWNLGYKFTPNTKVIVSLTDVQHLNSAEIMSNPKLYSGTNAGSIHCWYALNGALVCANVFRNTNQYHLIEYGNNYLIIRSNSSINKPTGTAVTNALTSNMLAGKSRGYKYYYIDIYENGTKIKHFVPVRIGTAAAFYDNIGGVIAHNESSGTGYYTLGPDKT